MINLHRITSRAFLLFFLPFLIFAASVLSCYKAPITGRNQLILLSTAEEIKLGTIAYQELKRKEKVSTNPVYNAAVKRVGKRIAKVVNIPDFKWEFTVFEDDKMINAFALPGGKVGVYTGIIKVAKNDAGLATVISHEIAHVVARHGAERVSVGILAELGASGIAVVLGSKDPKVVNSVLQAYGIGVTIAGILPFSRTQESEADRIGLIYMAKAGYDPREAIRFWERMEEAAKNSPSLPEFLSTHPGLETRIRNLKKWMPEALEIYRKNPKKANNYTIVN